MEVQWTYFTEHEVVQITFPFAFNTLFVEKNAFKSSIGSDI